jgi:hypothetical protein
MTSPNPLDAIAAEMKAAAEAATPGTWKVAKSGSPFAIIVKTESAGMKSVHWIAESGYRNVATHIAASNPANVLAILDDRDALRAILAKADEALRPFADAESHKRESLPDDFTIPEASRTKIRMGDLRRARAVLDEIRRAFPK